MRSQPNNKNSMSLKEPEERLKAYQSYCKHISDGYPKKAWSYRNGEFKCSWETMENYIKEFTTDLDPFLMRESHANSYKDWFDKGRNLSDGKVKGHPSPHTYAVIMRNMFNWDRDTREPERHHETHAETIFNQWKEQAPKTNEFEKY